jgi:hypothetical protein
MANLPTLPTRTPLADANGKMTKPWLDFLQSQLAAAGGSVTSDGRASGTVTPDGLGNVTLDVGAYENFRLVLSGTTVTILAPVSSDTIGAGLTFWLYFDQDTTGGRAIPAFTGGASGFTSDTQTQIQSVAVGTASTRTKLAFKFDGTYWHLDAVPYSGGATS